MYNSIIRFYQTLDYKSDILLFPFALFLPLYPPLSQICMLLYIVFWFVNKQYRYLSKIKRSSFAVGSIIYFGIFALSGLYSSNLSDFGADIEAKLSLLIIPIILTSRAQYNEKVVYALFWTFSIGCCMMVTYLYFDWLLGSKDIFRSIVPKISSFNVIYYSMYLVFVQLFLMIELLKKPKLSIRTLTIGFVLIVLHYALYAIASRMAILSLITIELGSVFLWKIWMERRFVQGAIILIGIVIVNGLSIKFIQQTPSNRFTSGSIGVHRLQVWKAGLLQFSKSPIIGYGSGDAKDIMYEGYLITGYEHGASRRWNCHNQYLETGISVGILGIIMFIGWLVMSYVQGWKHQHYLASIVVALFALNFLTESMLERQQGSYFVAFIGSIVFWKILSTKNHELHSKTKN